MMYSCVSATTDENSTRTACGSSEMMAAVARLSSVACSSVAAASCGLVSSLWQPPGGEQQLEFTSIPFYSDISSTRGSTLTFGAHVPIESPVLGKAAVALWAFERLFSGVVADVSHQGAFLAEASGAELTDVRFLVAVGPLMHLQGILSKRGKTGLEARTDGNSTNGRLLRLTHFGLVAFAASGTVVGPLVRVRSHVLANVPDGFVQLAALAALVPPFADVDFHVFFQQVTSQKLLLAQGALEGLVTCARRRKWQTVNLFLFHVTTFSRTAENVDIGTKQYS